MADGLTENRVMIMYEDRLGFLWLLSKNGLTRYDGEEMIPYTVRDGLPDLRPEGIFEDSKGDIWVLTRKGLARYNGYGFEAVPLPDERSYSELSAFYCIDDQDRILLHASATDGDNNLIEFKDGKYIPLEIGESGSFKGELRQLMYSRVYSRVILILNDTAYFLENNRLSKMLCATNRTLFFETGNELYAHNEINKFYRVDNRQLFEISEKEYFRAHNNPYTYFSRGDIWLQLNSYQGEEPVRWRDAFINFAFRDSRGITWLGTEEGLYRLLSEEIMLYDTESGITGDVWSIIEDKEGNMWFTSMTGAIQRYDGKSFTDMSALLPPGILNFTSGSRRMADGTIWFTSFRAIIVWDGSSFRRLNMVNDQVEYIFEDKADGTIMLGYSKGLLVLRGKDKELFEEMSPYRLGFVRDICKIKTGLYMIASNKAFYLFDGKEFTMVSDKDGVNINPVSVHASSDGTVWLGGDSGLYTCDLESMTAVPALPGGENIPVRAIDIIGDSSVIAGRFGDFIIINTDSIDAGGCYQYTRYDKSAGFFSSGFNQNGIFPDSRGNYWLAGNEMVLRYTPGKNNNEVFIPKLFICSVEVLNQSGEWISKQKFSPYNRQDDQVQAIVLGKDERNIRINYISISGNRKVKAQYAYTGGTQQKERSGPVQGRSVDIPGVIKGKSTVNISLVPDRYCPGSVSASLEITRKPAFYETIVFWVLATLLLALIVFMISSFLIRKRQKQEKQKMKLINEQYRLQMGSFIQQFDPHFTFNVLNSLSAFYHAGRQEEADEYLVRFAGLLRTVISETDYTRSLDKEIKFISGYCEMQKIKMGNRLSFMVEVDDPGLLETQVPRMMIHNFVENSIKWGLNPKKDGGEIRIKVSRNGGTSVIITDTGIGRSEAAKLNYKGTGKGLAVTKSLIEVLNSHNKNKIELSIDDLHKENGHTFGTRVKITFPTGYNYFLKE